MRAYARYTNAQRKALLLEYKTSGQSSHAFSSGKCLKWSTWRNMLQREDAILNKKVNGKKATLGGQGRHESIPFANDMAAFMKDVCDQEHILTHTHLISFMKLHHMEWLEDYLAAKTNDDRAYHSLMRLCQRFSLRYRYSQRVPCVTRLTQAVLRETRDNFAGAFWDKFRDTADEDIINVDETSVYYDMPPGKTLAPIGGSSKVDTSQKHSDRMTAVLTIRSNGKDDFEMLA